MTYEVQHYTIPYGWVNTWQYDEGDGPRPETFATSEEAKAALDEFLEDLYAEYDRDVIPRFYDRTEFRIREVRADAYPHVQVGA